MSFQCIKQLSEKDKLKKQVEKLKNDKTGLSEENKQLQTLITQLTERVEDLTMELVKNYIVGAL